MFYIFFETNAVAKNLQQTRKTHPLRRKTEPLKCVILLRNRKHKPKSNLANDNPQTTQKTQEIGKKKRIKDKKWDS